MFIRRMDREVCSLVLRSGMDVLNQLRRRVGFTFSALMALILFLAIAPAAQSQDFTYDIVGGTSVTIAGYTGLDTEVSIPATIAGLPVTVIGDRAFYEQSALTSITIPNGVTSIELLAFSYCTGLASITIPNSVSSIEGYAFKRCSGLESIHVDDANEVYGSIDGVLFTNDKTSLLLFPEGRRGQYFVPNSVTSIGDSAFSRCSGLESITIPNSLASIGDAAYSWCTSLESITIPGSVTSIGWEAFSECTSLGSITINDNMVFIEDRAFFYCIGLRSIYFEGGGPPTLGSDVFFNVNDATVYYDSLIDDWPDTFGGLPTAVFPFTSSSVNGGIRLDSYSGNVARIALPNSIAGAPVVAVGNSLFIDHSELTHVALPVDAETLGSSAFQNCDNLTSLTMGDKVISVGDSTFANCTSLTDITLSSSVTFLGDSAFAGCANLATVNIPEDLTTLSAYTYSGCSSLTSLTFPGGITAFGESALEYCNSLESLYFEGNAPSLGLDALLGVSGLTVFNLPGSTGDWTAFDAYGLVQSWNPNIESASISHGEQLDQFGFNVTGWADMSFNVEVCDDLSQAEWSKLETFTIEASGETEVTDLNWASYPNRFYRLRMPQ